MITAGCATPLPPSTIISGVAARSAVIRPACGKRGTDSVVAASAGAGAGAGGAGGGSGAAAPPGCTPAAAVRSSHALASARSCATSAATSSACAQELRCHQAFELACARARRALPAVRCEAAAPPRPPWRRSADSLGAQRERARGPEGAEETTQAPKAQEIFKESAALAPSAALLALRNRARPGSRAPLELRNREALPKSCFLAGGPTLYRLYRLKSRTARI